MEKKVKERGAGRQKKNHRRKTRRQANSSHGKNGRSTSGRKWSAGVTEHSDALDLEKGVFTSSDPEKIAKSLRRSAKRSNRKKGTAYQSAMSMLNFYINRAGKNIPAGKKKVLTKAKDKLKEMDSRDK